MNENLKSCAGFAWDAFLLFAVFLLIIALPAYAAKAPMPKARSCEDQALYVIQVIHAKKDGHTLEWIIKAVSEANDKYNDPLIKTEQLVLVARWAYTYPNSEESAVIDYMKICQNPMES